MAEAATGVGKCTVRKAVVGDVPSIQTMVNGFAAKQQMLSRSLMEIYENVRDYFVAVDDGRVVGSAALHVFWNDLAEIRALAIKEEYQGKGLGRILVDACRQEASSMGLSRIFTLTFQPGFFKKMSFTEISKDELPHKVWSDCIKCPMFPDCDETALTLELEKTPS